MRKHMQGIRYGMATLLLSVVFSGCNDSTGPGIQPQIINAADNFEYQVTDVQNYSHALNYTWQNTGTTATINQATTVTAGSMTLVILDANGTQVYSRSLAENGTFASTAGTAGTWRVRVVYTNASGTVNFRVQKTT